MSGRTLVTGATGRQGGAVARHLLDSGHRVRVLTRSPDGPAARRLAGLGAEVVGGDLRDSASVDAALVGVTTVFSVQDYWQPGVGYDGEIRQGRGLVDAAVRAGVELFVQSGLGANVDAPGVAHFASRKVVVDYVRASPLPSVVLGLVVYMDNLLTPRVGPMMLATFAGGLGRHTPLELVAVDDVGAVTARVLANPDPYLGTVVDLVGDVLTVPQMRAAYRRVLRRPLAAWAFPRRVLPRLTGEFAHQLAWHREQVGGWPGLDPTGIPEVPMTDFATFLGRHRPWLV